MTKLRTPKPAKARPTTPKKPTLAELEQRRRQLADQLSAAVATWTAFLDDRSITVPCQACAGKGEMHCGSLGDIACMECGGSGRSYETPDLPEPPEIQKLRDDHTKALHDLWSHHDQAKRCDPSLYYDEQGPFDGGVLDGSLFGAGVGSMTAAEVERALDEDDLLDLARPKS